MERKKTRLNESEMKVMQIIWNAGQPITGQQVLGQITEQYKGSWHPRTIYPLMRKLSEKGMIRDVGSARVGKVYARQFLPARFPFTRWRTQTHSQALSRTATFL